MTQVAPTEAKYKPTPDLRERLLNMSSDELNLFLLQSPADIEKQYPGFLDGRFLQENYDETTWGLQNTEHAQNVLYAGCESFEYLQRFTYERIHEVLMTLPGDATYDYIYRGNIGRSLQLVQDFMQDETRRTGEPGVAHIYRTVLRVVELIEIFNRIAKNKSDDPYIDGLGAEFLICSAIMHDFLEDSVYRDADIDQKGFVVQTDGAGTYFGIIDHGKERQSSGYMDFGSDSLNDAFVLTLEALNSALSPNQLMEHLSECVEDVYDRFGQSETTNLIILIAAYLVKCCDRLDNNATYFKSASKLIEKAVENLRLFAQVLPVFQQCAHDDTLRPDDLVSLERRYLHYLPDRVAKLLLAGLSPQEIYNRHEDGRGIPRSM